MPPQPSPPHGLLVSAEGVSGTGKTYLTDLLTSAPGLPAGTAVIDEFSRRPPDGDLGRELLAALAAASGGDPLLRGGQPAAETLLLLAVKAHDYEEHCVPALADGAVILEGRSVHTTAVYQALILHPDDDEAAFTDMQAILADAARWRPLPDLTFLITGDPGTAAARAARRDSRPFTADYLNVHHRAAALYERSAAHDPGAFTVIDRRTIGTDDAVALMRKRILAGWQEKNRRGTPVTAPAGRAGR
jgi:dTMP kinase